MPILFTTCSVRNLKRKTEEVWKRTIRGERKICLGLLRCLLYPLSFPYFLAFLVFRKIQSMVQEELLCPVISIGNITLGGTGKTSLTILLSKKLETMGYKVAILCTGYGGRREGKVETKSPEEFGDEAFLITNSVERSSVWAGRDRLKMAKKALEEGAEVIVMDDGMQYFKIKKDLEIVMLNALSPFGYGYLFPRGALREPLSGLKRADVLILNNAELKKGKERILQRLREINPSSILLEANYAPSELLTLPGEEKVPIEWLKGKRVMGIAGIGSPEGFKKTLERLAGEVVFRPFPDHHHFSQAELIALQEEAKESASEAIVITDKDGVKVKGLLEENFPLKLPFFVLSVELKLSSEEELWRRVGEVLRKKAPQKGS